ncbi:MAG: ABC-2 type transport system ATP-binding protein [Kiritimatiellia bacterium]|jgi:ABC-2 type transport system ATP-binding protein
MIRVEQLTKKYAGTVAVNNLSFRVNRGEIVGFLGPNGAGKTTTMRIISGYLPATGGRVEVAGRDVFKESIEVRRRIGYLPENCPLYLDMRVDEYLKYRANLKGVPLRERKERIREVKLKCSLMDVSSRIIGQLSKGYRQRVGLADALVHDPEILILDEPTSGLDPNQIRQVRKLIRTLAQTHTILLSTHILPEVETTCDRVLIINEGQIIASDTPETLRNRLQSSSNLELEVMASDKDIKNAFNRIKGIRFVRTQKLDAWTLAKVECEDGLDLRDKVFEMVVKQGWKCRELRQEKKSLEDVFVEMTGTVTPAVDPSDTAQGTARGDHAA